MIDPTIPTHPLPTVDDNVRSRNEERPPFDVERCAVCSRPLPSPTWAVYSILGSDAIEVAAFLARQDEIEADAGYSGIYFLGTECGRKIPAAFRFRVN